MQEAKGELDKAYKETRHVDSSVSGGVGSVGVCFALPFLARRSHWHRLPVRHPHRPTPISSLQRNRLQLQLDEVEGQLREARTARKESERDRRVNEAISALKNQYRDRELAACKY